MSAIVGGALLSFSSHGVDYMMVQRVLGTRNLTAARKAMVGSGIFVFLQFGVFLLAGSLIYLLMGGVEIERDREFTTFIVDYLPVGLKGVLLAGVLSAAMSTLSSSINSLASSTVTDWLGGNQSIRRSQLVSLIWGLVLIAIALLFDESDSAIVIVGLQIASFTYGGLLGLFLLSKMKRDIHPVSLMVGLISSLLIVFYLKQVGIAWTWFIGISVVTNMFITLLIDRFVILVNKPS
jgi:Na+/proline symporter